MALANRSGSLRPKNANAVIVKNTTATMTQSPRIIPFYNYFKNGINQKSPQPLSNWLTRK
jgi:hypothetical protein